MEQREFEFMTSPVTRYDIYTDTNKPVEGTDLSVLLEISKAYAEIRVARGEFREGPQADILDDIHAKLLNKVGVLNGSTRPR